MKKILLFIALEAGEFVIDRLVYPKVRKKMKSFKYKQKSKYYYKAYQQGRE